MPRFLGRVASPFDPRTLRLANYLSVAELPPAPATVSWGAKVPKWGAMLNDKIGDCTVAATGHLIQQWTGNDAGSVVTVPDSEILKAYCAVSGYAPGKASTDNGANMLDVLKYWRGTGIGGHKGIGYVAVDPLNLDQVRAALWLFGGLYGGCLIPNNWLDGAWDKVSGGWAGGHAWELCSYDSKTGDFGVVTWGEVRRFTAKGWAATMQAQRDAELYAVLPKDEWTGADKLAPSGFDLAALQNDLAIIGGQPLPNPVPEPTPTPVPVPASGSGVLTLNGVTYDVTPRKTVDLTACV